MAARLKEAPPFVGECAPENAIVAGIAVKNFLLALALALANGVLAGSAAAAPAMRVDYYHTGNAREERFSLDRVVVEPLEWPGSPDRPFDTSGLGKYFFEVLDAESGRLLFSRGFNSVYGEWETTAEAQALDRTFSESLRFPSIDKPARIVVKKRDRANVFREVWTLTVDPAAKFIERGARAADAGPLIRIHEAGDPTDKLDILFVGDGYTVQEREKFERDARRMATVLLATAPFRERQRDINVWGLVPGAVESGVSRPSQQVHRRPPLGTTYDAFGTERYILTFENRVLRDVASNAPYEVLEILVNETAYGGGGIFGQYGTVAVDSAWAAYLLVHEFGHHVAGLADEYYSSDVAYLPAAERLEPWEPNATALLDPGTLKWRDLVAPGTPLPTPWPRAEFELYTKQAQAKRQERRAAAASEEELDALCREQQAFEMALLGSSPHAGKVGAFEGANYEAHGYFRPEIDCIMFSRNKASFCEVCRRAIEAIINLYSRR
jgi:hypothetical protein